MNDNTDINEGRRATEAADEGADLPSAPTPKPLKEWANPNCKRCYGTGKDGYAKPGKPIMCRCVRHRLFQEMLKIEKARREPVTLKVTDERLKQMGIEVKDDNTHTPLD